ncbi:MAG: hypothetical protein AAGD38_15835 [Acidobacteriota bacterium]
MSRPTELVTQRHRLADTVVLAAEEFGEITTPEFATLMRSVLEEGETLDVDLMQIALSRIVKREQQTLNDRADRLYRRRSDDNVPRRRRDAAVETLRQRLIQVRASMRGSFGSAADSLLGLDGSTESLPERLLPQARVALDSLRNPAAPFPEPLIAGTVFDPAPLVATLEGPLTELDEAYKALKRYRRREEIDLEFRNEVLAEFDQRLRGATQMLEGLCRLVGKTGLADRIRPTRRRRGSDEEEPLEPVGEEPSQEPVTVAPEEPHEPSDGNPVVN